METWTWSALSGGPGSGRRRATVVRREVPGGRLRAAASTTTSRPRPPSRAPSLREYGQYKELFYNLTLRDLRSKYKRSVIGWGWSMINPLANMAVYTIVFSMLLNIHPPLGVPSGIHNYALMLLAAMLPFNFFQGSVMESMGCTAGQPEPDPEDLFPARAAPGLDGGLQDRLPPDRDGPPPGGRRRLRQLEGADVRARGARGNGGGGSFRPRAGAPVLDRQRVLPGHLSFLGHIVLHLDVPHAGRLPLLHRGWWPQRVRPVPSRRQGTSTCSATRSTWAPSSRPTP